ncbi:MAG: sulfurtransferase-like selenium metabolism protein YedF [Helicobacter sp.]|nr:sulfurtransferase-like selenium metabolism protein YedF [Helicobacteraceae bacterium]MDY3113932.1 sulfurtransferase-like selenium metabolism protein YedF [Helicobacter sp.]
MKKVLVIKSDCMGENSELGRKLMIAFLSTLAISDSTPKSIYLLNRGVFLSTTNEESILIFKKLEEKGVKIYSCQTCLNAFSLMESLKVGEVGNMQGVVGALLEEDSVVL